MDAPRCPSGHSRVVDSDIDDDIARWVTEGVANSRIDDRSSEGAIKFDANKTPYHLISPLFLEGLALVLKDGANKYGERNWEKGMNWSRLYRASFGHQLDWYMRRGPDSESGLSHLLHAAACLMMLYEYEVRRLGNDDRP